MATPSPICEVKDGSGSYVSTTDGVDVTVGNTISIRLASTTGVDVWSIQCISTDETSTAPALTVNYTTKVATFTAPAAGKALRFKSTVTSQSSKLTSSCTFGVYTLTASGDRVVAYQETTEGDSSFGWVTSLNGLVRRNAIVNTFANIPDASLVPTGTKFIPTDGGPECISDGSSWRPMMHGVLGKRPPLASNWTGRNEGSSSLSDANGSLYLLGQDNGSNNYLRGYELTSDATSGFIMAGMHMINSTFTTSGGVYSDVGIYMAESATGKAIAFGRSLDHNRAVTYPAYTTWASATSRSTAPAGAFSCSFTPNYFRMKLSGSNILVQMSVDKVTWVTMVTQSKAGAFTTGPDRVGIFTAGYNSVPGAVIWDLDYL